jgi:acyl-CoA synthetase (NDP forming)
MFLTEIKSKNILRDSGIPVVETFLACSKKEAVQHCKKVGFPVVLKIVSDDIVHKSESGGVRLGLQSPRDVERAYDEILASVASFYPGAKIEGIAVQHMAPHGTEVIIGMSKDPVFGATVMFGLGGIFVELLKDVSFRVTPLIHLDAAEMIREIKGYKILTGFRNQPAVDIQALEQLLLKISQFAEAHPEVQEIDLNPVIAYPDGYIVVDARINIDEKWQPSVVSKPSYGGGLDFLFNPKSVAIMGASDNPLSSGHDFLYHMLNFGYKGNIYPVSVKSREIMGLPAYSSLEQIPGEVEHVIYCIGLEHMPDFLDQCSRKGVRTIHIFAAHGAETGRAEAKELEAEIKRKAKQYGIRTLGPNCMGVYCPGSGFRFFEDASRLKGGIGGFIQSGGSSTDVIRYGAMCGLRFSKLVSYGNALDINEMDLLQYLYDDPQTKVIIAFIEGLRGDGKAFLDLVRKTSLKKPFIVVKGGMSKAGARATMSHTASLAGSSLVWETAIRQAGGIPVKDIDDMVNLATAFIFLPRIKGKRVGTGGSGGGRNTISADQWEAHGFEVVPLPKEIKEEFKRRGSVVWDEIDNPADRSITVLGDAYTVPALLTEMAKHPSYDFICANVAAEDHVFNLETFRQFVGKSLEGYIQLYKQGIKPCVIICATRPVSLRDTDYWLWKEVINLKTRLVEEKVPFFPSVDKAAEAINELIWAYDYRDKRQKEG